MPYAKRKTGKKYEVYNSDTGEAVPGGSHASESAADAHIKALYANVEDAQSKVDQVKKFDEAETILEKSIEDSAGQPKEIFIPFTKIDEAKRQVWGYGAKEEPDRAGEIMDWETSRPFWKDWTDTTRQRSGGKSLGNMREMHKEIASGRAIAVDLDDQGKGAWIGSEVVDDNTWRKVQAGVLTGYSVGGSYVRRWPDPANPKLVRYTAKPNEVSYVDAPCIPGATFQVIKSDGTSENRAFAPGNTGELVKVDLPDSPRPVGMIPAEPQVIEKMPSRQKSPTQIDPENPPEGETLAVKHPATEDLSEQAKAAAEGTEPVKKVIHIKPHEQRLIKVRRRTIRVIKQGALNASN